MKIKQVILIILTTAFAFSQQNDKHYNPNGKPGLLTISFDTWYTTNTTYGIGYMELADDRIEMRISKGSPVPYHWSLETISLTLPLTNYLTVSIMNNWGFGKKFHTLIRGGNALPRSNGLTLKSFDYATQVKLDFHLPLYKLF